MSAGRGLGSSSASNQTGQGDDALGWVLLPPEHVPQRWHGRGHRVVLVPLLAEELASVLAGQPALPGLDERDEQLLRMAARGATVAQMAKAVGLSTRGVGHRLARLRERFDAATTAELVAQLARRGFSLAETGNALSEVKERSAANPSQCGGPDGGRPAEQPGTIEKERRHGSD